MCACGLKAKREGPSPARGKARVCEATPLASLVILQPLHVSVTALEILHEHDALVAPPQSHLCLSYGRGPSGTLCSRNDWRRPRKLVLLLAELLLLLLLATLLPVPLL